MSNSKKENNLLLKGILALTQCLILGFKKYWKEKNEYHLYLISIVMFSVTHTYEYRFLWSRYVGIGKYLPKFIYRLLLAIPWPYYTGLLIGMLILIFSFVLGNVSFKLNQNFQKKLNRVKLIGYDGSFFNVIAVDKIDEYRTTVVIKSVGIGLDKYQQNKSDIESSLAEEVDSIVNGANPQIVILNLTKRKLPKMIAYHTLDGNLVTPNSFIIGESMKGVVTRTLDSLPHLLIAGTTGGGKSVFFKQTLLSLLKTTPNLQLYLLDLKRGVEMKDFGELPNVRIAKTEEEACKMLKKIKEEMDRRFEYLEKSGHKEIVPQRDGFDKIVVGIDEASVLYTKVKSNNSKALVINAAREYTDELAKLARAAGIHLILATQKVSKETIDTKVQENIGGRVCFRMNTMVNSVTVLGNKKAFELPDIKGRAIWASGNEFLELQCPFISDDELKAEIEVFQEKYKANYPCKKRMIEIETGENNKTKGSVPNKN